MGYSGDEVNTVRVLLGTNPGLRQVFLRDVLRFGGTLLSAQGDLTRSKKLRTSGPLNHPLCSAALDIGGGDLPGWHS